VPEVCLPTIPPHTGRAAITPDMQERIMPACLYGIHNKQITDNKKLENQQKAGTMKNTNEKPLTQSEVQLVAAIRAKGGDVEARFDADGKRYFVAKGRAVLIRATPSNAEIKAKVRS